MGPAQPSVALDGVGCKVAVWSSGFRITKENGKIKQTSVGFIQTAVQRNEEIYLWYYLFKVTFVCFLPSVHITQSMHGDADIKSEI